MRSILLLSALALAVSAAASDHNNIDKDRPLQFDDAYSIAYGSLEFQSGFRFDVFNRSRPLYGLRTELQYGFAKNRDVSIGVEPTYDAGNGKTSIGILDIGCFVGLQREIGDSPALGYSIDLGLPVDRGRRGVETRLRGILTKTLGQYDKVHLNLDLHYDSAPAGGERSTTFAGIIGYSAPVGYPRHFDTTFLAEFGLEQSKLDAGGINGWLGIGMRRQLSPTSVLDIGIQSDIFSAKGGNRTPVRFSVGISFNF